MDIALRVEKLGKVYRVGRKVERYQTLRESVMNGMSNLYQRIRSPIQSARASLIDNQIWALKDIDLKVHRGELLGIVGRNGAGKSTLLKILSRIVEPTVGYAEIHGRVGALLEVGTGFHPELTGRENVYLNGAILGMRNSETRRKFDEIVSFAEVEKFIDTPVKHYSTGMHMRLAFAVAAHLEPEVLLVDEVLAVGDASFWSKCTNKMRALNDHGMTIILVTHNMWHVQTICSRAVCLDKGKVIAEGNPFEVISAYRTVNENSHNGAKKDDVTERDEARILDFQLVKRDDWSTEKEALSHSGLTLSISARVGTLSQVRLLVRVSQPDGFTYFTIYSDLIDVPPSGSLDCTVTIPHLMLLSGEYFLRGAICAPEDEEHILAEEGVPFFVKGDHDTTLQSSVFWNYGQWDIRGAN